MEAIAARPQDGLNLGHGEIPWVLPEYFKWFENKTIGHVVVMGRTTHELIGAPLTHRENIVITQHDKSFDGCTTIHSWSELANMSFGDKTVFIIGGKLVLTRTLAYCSDLWITHTPGESPGNGFFPTHDSSYDLVSHDAEFEKHPDIEISHYINRHYRPLAHMPPPWRVPTKPTPPQQQPSPVDCQESS